jgi:hypothetical protein
VPAGAILVPGDIDGRGCTLDVRWWPARAEAERHVASESVLRLHLGRPGDQLVLGDWDHDGRDTPGLYDPATGEVDRFDAWAAPDAPVTGVLVTRDAPVGGRARVHRARPGDTILIDR